MLAAIIRISVLLAIFASVFVFSQLLLNLTWRNRQKTAAVNKRMQMIKAGSNRDEIFAQLRKNTPSEYAHLPPMLQNAMRGIQRMLLASALPMTTPQLVLIMGIALAALSIVLLFVMRAFGFAFAAGPLLLILVVAACATVILPLMVISVVAQRRRKRVEAQFPIALDVFVRALRSGHPIASAIDLLTHEMEDPIGSEFGLVGDEVSYGASLTDALDSMADRWNLEDMRMFVVSLSVQSETGGNLAEILENLSDVIRARASMYMKVRALSSEGRMTGVMLTVLPIFALVSMFLVNPEFYLDVAGEPAFLIGFVGLILLYLTGFIMIRRMIDLKV